MKKGKVSVSEQKEMGEFLIIQGTDPGMDVCSAYLLHVEPAMEIIIDSLSRSLEEFPVLDKEAFTKIGGTIERLQNVSFHAKTTLNVMRQIYRKYYDDVHG